MTKEGSEGPPVHFQVICIQGHSIQPTPWKYSRMNREVKRHLDAGNGGRKLSDVEPEQPDWLEYADREWGFARITVDGSRSLLVESVSSETGDVRDSVRLEIAASARRHCNLQSKPQALLHQALSSSVMAS